jgi:hypothetical protein
MENTTEIKLTDRQASKIIRLIDGEIWKLYHMENDEQKQKEMKEWDEILNQFVTRECDCSRCGEVSRHCPDCYNIENNTKKLDCPTCNGEGNIPL